MLPARRIVIIGGGPCGLGTAIRLDDLKHSDWILLEAEDNFGGLSASFTDSKGYTWDQGGHVGFSHYEYYDKILEERGPEMIRYDRRCKLFYRDGKYLVDYPVQLHTDQLPDDLTKIETSPDNSIIQNPRSFVSWVVKKFGWNLYYSFFRPYNEKVWTFPLEEMSDVWVAERVAEKPLEASDKPASSWGPNSKMSYPLRGGTGAVWRRLGESLDGSRVKLSTHVIKINVKSKTLITNNDSEPVTYDYLVSAMPLPRLCSMLNGEGDEELIKSVDRITHLSRQLKYSHTYLVGLGICQANKGDRITDKFHWAYFPEVDVPFYRCMVMSNLSTHVCPEIEDGLYRQSLLFEVAQRPLKWGGKAFESDVNKDLVEYVIAAAQRNKLIDPNSTIESIWTKTIEYGYPTPFLGRDIIIDEILQILETEFGILSRGRFGVWRYEISNMDHCFMQGVEVAAHVLSDQVGTHHGKKILQA